MEKLTQKTTEKKSETRNRIEGYIRQRLNNLTVKPEKPLKISIAKFHDIIENNFSYSNTDVTCTPHYSPGDITRYFITPIISKINDEIINNGSSYSFPFKVKTYYSNSKKKKALGYIFTLDREYLIALRLDEYMCCNNKSSLQLTYNSFIKLLNLEDNNTEMCTIKDIIETRDNNAAITSQEISPFTFSHALLVLKYLNEIAANNSSMPDCKTKYRYEMVEERKPSYPVSPTNKSNSYYLSYTFTKKEYQDDASTASDIPNKHFYPLMDSDALIYNSIPKWTYLTHLYLLYALNNSHTTSTDENGKTCRYIVELDAKSVWEFWYNSSMDKRFAAEFKKAVNELNNLRINITPPKKYFLLSRKEYTLIKKNSDVEIKITTPYTVYPPEPTDNTVYPPDSTDSEKFLVYIISNYANRFSFNNLRRKCPKKLIHLSPKTSYSQIRLFEFLHITFNELKTNKDNTTDYSIPISNIAIITGKLDLASEHISKYIDESIYTANNYDYLYNKIPDKDRFTHDLIYFFLKPNIARFNEYKKGEGESQIINMSRSNEKDNHTVLSFSLVSIDKQP